MPLSSDIVDGVVYSAERLFFTASPWATFSYLKDGQVVHETPLALETLGLRPSLPLYVERERDKVELGPDLLATIRVHGSTSASPSSGPLLKATGGRLKDLADGNTHSILLAYVAHYCHITSERTWSALYLATTIRQAFLDKKLDPDLDARRRFSTPEGIEAEFRALREGDVVSKLTRIEGAARVLPSIGEARNELTAKVAEIIRKALTSKTQSVTLVTSDPATGKTYAIIYGLIDALPLEFIRTKKVVLCTLRIDLGNEIVRRARAALIGRGGSEEEAVRLIRQHTGRSEHCDDPIHRPMADLMDSSGFSALKCVCPLCPKRDVCGFVAQYADTGPGLIVLQHHHLITSMRRLKPGSDDAPDLLIFDEDINGVLIQ